MVEQKEFKYYAFISYSRKNSKAAAYFHRQLEHFRIPVKYVAEENRPPRQKFLRPIFRDRRDLEANENSFTDDIKKALENSRYLIVLCSPESAQSKWVDEEIKYFLETHNNNYRLIVPVVLSGCPGCANETECLPLSLRLEEITSRNLPSMIPDEGEDEKNGWLSGVVQSMSYMLKVSREKIRATVDAERVRQIKIYALIFVGAALICMGFSVWAIFSRQQAREQAIVAQNTLSFFRDIFISTDPTKDGERDKKVVECIKDKTEQILHLRPWDLRVKIESICGEILSNLGEYNTAEVLLCDGVNIVKEKEVAVEELGVIYNNLSVIYFDLEKYDIAYKCAVESLRFKSKYHKSQADTWVNVGMILSRMNKLDEGLKYFKKAERAYKRENNSFRLSTVYNNIADNCFHGGKIDESIVYLNKSINIARKIYPPDSFHMGQLYSNLCSVYMNMTNAQVDVAENFLKKAQQIFEKRKGVYSTEILNCKLKSIEIKCLKREYDAAFREGDEFIKVCNNLPCRDYGFIGKRYNSLGMLYYMEGQFDKAIEYLTLAKEKLNEVYGEKHVNMALIYSNIAAACYKLGEYDLALTNIQASLRILSHKELKKNDSMIDSNRLRVRCFYHSSRIKYAIGRNSDAYSDAEISVVTGKNVLSLTDEWQIEHEKWLNDLQDNGKAQK